MTTKGKMITETAAKTKLFVILLIGALHFSYTGAQRLEIYPRQAQVKRIATGAMFTCTILDYVHYGPEPDIFWRAAHGEIITNTKGRIYVERVSVDSHRLYISSVREDDAGLYSCESIINGILYTADTKLEIFEDIQFRESPDKFELRTGDSPFLECSATGHPQPRITWRFNRKPIISDNVKYLVDPTRGLQVFNLTREDAGFYECRAEVTSQGNLKVKVITVDVKYKPFMSYQPSEVTEVIMGERAELKCQGIGNPEVTYQWFKEHEMGAHAKVKVMLQEDSDTLVIEHVTRQDGGRYFCKVSNELGSAEVYTDVTVLMKPEVEELPAEKPLENNVLFLNCKVKGFPEPEVTWQRIGNDAPYVEGIQPDDARIKVDNSRRGISQLVIHEITRAYSGLYRCTAVNKAGNDSSTANVTVEYVPTINTTDYEKYGWPGQVRNFTCVGDGLPLPTINWLREGQYIVNSSTYKVFTNTTEKVTSTLQIIIRDEQPWVFGSYSCIAKNRYNYVRRAVHLREATVPEMPRNLSVEEETATSVELRASVDRKSGGLPVTSWKVQYKPTKRQIINEFDDIDLYEEREKEMIYQTDEKIIVEGLTPDSEYTFYLSAGNDVGYGDPVKFKVKTPKLHTEQADLPGDPDTGILRIGADGNEAQNYNNKLKEVKSDDAAPGLASVGIATGVSAVVLVVVVAVGAVVCFRRRRSRDKEDDYTSTWRSMFGNGRKAALGERGATVKVSESKDIDQMQLEIRRVGSSQPDLIAQASPKPAHAADRCRSPLEIRKQNGHAGSPRRCPPEPAGTPNTIQRRAWERMLMTQELEADEPEVAAVVGVGGAPDEKPEELTPIVELPPPPQFLLDNNDDVGPASADGASYHDILDGYHSEENVDDGDRFEIRIPPPEAATGLPRPVT